MLCRSILTRSAQAPSYVHLRRGRVCTLFVIARLSVALRPCHAYCIESVQDALGVSSCGKGSRARRRVAGTREGGGRNRAGCVA
ncbi:hypothetical protein BD309DRAFT_965237 [Dichomitus squalens]|nr:hypothetical protein BD309DRAFT_965237 [Dichomitus squalens]